MVTRNTNYFSVIGLVSLSLLSCALCLAQTSENTASSRWNDSSFTVHGRLMLCNGNPTFRIWVVGTNHILGVHQTSDEIPSMPDTLKILAGWDKYVYGIFVVKSLSKYRKGEMQFVQVISYSNLLLKKR